MHRPVLVIVLLSIAAIIAVSTRAAPSPSVPARAGTPTRALYAPIIAKPEPPTATVAPTVTPTSAPVPIVGIANGGFEQGHVGWVEIPGNAIITQFGPIPPYSGQWEASLGGGIGGVDEIQQVVTLPAQGPIWLNFAYQGDPNDSSGVPVFNILINETYIWNDYPLPTGWKTLRMDVSAYTGQTVTLRFRLTESLTYPGGMIVDDVFLSR